MSGDVDIAWTRFAPTSVTMRGRSRTIGGGGTEEMELVAHDGLWQVDLDQPLTSAARVTGVIEGRARADGWAEVELDGALHLTCTDLGRCREVLAPAASSADTDLLTGSLAAEVRVNGTLGRPRLTGSVAVADVGVGALSGIQLEANVSADLTTLDVASAVGRLGNNVIRGRVRVVWDGGLIDGAIDGELRDLELLTPMLPAEWAPRGTVRVAAAIAGSVSSPSFDRITLTGNQLVLTPLFAGTPDEIPIAGRVNLEFEGSGPVAAPVGTTTVEATDLAWNNYRLGTARATIAVDGGTVHGQAELPEFSAVAEIALDLADRRTVDLIVDVADADLARVAADTAVPLAGTASLGAHVTYAFGESVGSAAAERVTVDIQLRSIEGSVGDTPVRLVQPADLRYLPTDISTDHVELTVGGTRANALRFTPGDVVDLSEWNLARTRLYDTGVFRLVDIQAVPVEPSAASVYEPVTAKVVLEERPAYSLRYGVAVSDRDAPPESGSARDFGLAFAGDFSRRNLLGRAATVGVSVRAALDRETFRGYFSIPHFFGAPITMNIYAENRRETLGEENAEFVTDLRTLTFEQRVRRPGSLSFVYSANFERNRTFDKDPDPDFPFDLTLYLLRVNGSALIDKRDNLFDARRGWFHASTIEYGFEPGKGAVELAKYFGQQYHYWPVGPIVLASAGRVGLATGLGSDLIPSDHFFAGGGNTVRGYPQDSLGPRNLLGGVAGGNALVVLNQELRFPVFWRLSGVGFIDAGNVFETVKRISLSDLAVGAGLGLRLDTPVGLLRFDYGFALRRSLLVSQPGENDPPIGQFFFSIGQAF